MSETKIYPSKARRGLGEHIRKGSAEGRFCRGPKIRKRGYRNGLRKFSTVFGTLSLSLRVAECGNCGARYSPLLSALKIGEYARKEGNFEHEVIEAVIDTNYRRLIDGRSIDISLGGIHNIVVGSDVDQLYQDPVSVADLSGIMADGTGLKQYKGRKGELRSVIGITTAGRVEPLGSFTNTDWLEKDLENRPTCKNVKMLLPSWEKRTRINAVSLIKLWHCIMKRRNYMGLLDGKKALVAGVANKKSIAWGIAQALYAHGAQLAFTCHETNVRRVRKLAPQVNSEIIIPCDVGKDEDIMQTFDQLAATFDGELDILVHSIAYANMDDLGGEFIKTSRSGWHLALDISAYSLVAFARCARPLMDAAGGGSIMTLTFGDGKVIPGYNIMGVTKAALEVTVRYLAYDLGPENIRVNAIGAGPIPTISSLAIEDFSVALRIMEERSPLLRNVTLKDVGKTAVYLASDLSSAVTGAVIKVDSGMNIMCPATTPHRKLKKAHDARLKKAPEGWC